MATIHVLIVEPAPRRRERLAACLSHETGFEVVGAGDDFMYVGQLPFLRRSPVEILLINIDQPDMIRTDMWATIHVLLPNARIVALTEGTDDSILKAALGAGVTALYRLDADPDILRQVVRKAAQGLVDYDRDLVERAKSSLFTPSEETQVRISELVIDFQAQEATRKGKPIHLTPLEFKVLAHLARNRGRPVSSAELLEAVWQTPASEGGTMAQVRNCIKRLRRKIEPGTKHLRYIQSFRGWGYVLRDPHEQ